MNSIPFYKGLRGQNEVGLLLEKGVGKSPYFFFFSYDGKNKSSVFYCID